MAERPILFSMPMVQAILAGRKTQTRRAIKRPLKHPGWTYYTYFGPSKNNPTASSVAIENGPDYPDADDDVVPCPYGVAGDRLWVREAWLQDIYDGSFQYRATHPSPKGPKWKPSIHMPRHASRITLRIREIRAEQLIAISSDDAAAEGWPGPDEQGTIRSSYPIAWYSHLWEQINGRGSWSADTWVWVLKFERVDAQRAAA